MNKQNRNEIHPLTISAAIYTITRQINHYVKLLRSNAIAREVLFGRYYFQKQQILEERH